MHFDNMVILGDFDLRPNKTNAVHFNNHDVSIPKHKVLDEISFRVYLISLRPYITHHLDTVQ